MNKWKPTLSDQPLLPIYRRLVEAMAADIQTGRLSPGTRLPPQRWLAHELSISLGSVTRAYEEATQRGLVHAHVGRGTFVADRQKADVAVQGPIDLSVNTAPIFDTTDAITQTITSLRKVAGLQDRMSYLPPWGLEADRKAAAAWIRITSGLQLNWQQLLCCTGAQGSMALATGTICRAGDTIICEAATFTGMKALAVQQGYQLRGIAVDEEGAVARSLDRAVKDTGARVFYTLPTLHNPTARIASRGRREAIVKLARARDLFIIEDDVYGIYARSLDLPTYAELAPERTFFLTSLSKTLAPGLRVGFLAPPKDYFERCAGVVRALQHSPPGLGSAIATDWITSGRAEEMIQKIRAEVSARTELAISTLGTLVEKPASKMTLHLWMPLPALEAESIAGRALRAGLRLSSPGAQAVKGADAPTGLRICIGSAANRATLDTALAILKQAARGEAPESADQL
jgi:DNA-binding transcriptional MocR family regulator